MPDAEAPSTRFNGINSEATKGRTFKEFGISGDDLLELRSVGLIRSDDEGEFPDLTTFFSASSAKFAGTAAKLAVTPNASTRMGFSVVDATKVISLTRVGNELRGIISLTPHQQYATRLMQVMWAAGVDMADRKSTRLNSSH